MTKCAFGKELRAVILHSHFAQLRGHWAKQGLAPMNEQVIEAMAASNSLRAPFDNTKRRLDGRERYVVGHHRLG